MRRVPFYKLLVFIIVTIIFIIVFCASPDKYNVKSRIANSIQSTVMKSLKTSSKKIVISFVVCNSRFNESLNVVKSVLLFTRTPVHLVIFTDQELKPLFNKTLTRWKLLTNNQLDFELHDINFPKDHEQDWLYLFRKCAAQRLFIPKLIPHHEALIYVDTDTLFLGPADELWDHFSKFNSSQMSAMSLEHESPNLSWYPRFAKHPFYGKLGLNSGVMLMNLAKMRDFGWTDYVTPIMLKWKLNIPWGDQDIINIIFHHHPDAVLELSCRYNFRPDQCMYGDACHDATKRGVFLLHGSRGVFHHEKQPAFKAISRAIEEYQVGSNPSNMYLKIDNYLSEASQSNCGNLKDAFLKVPTKTLKDMYANPKR